MTNAVSLLDDQENHIIGILKEAKAKFDKKELSGRPLWTNFIKSKLTELAYDKYGFRVYSNANSYDDTLSEWLYDLVWYKSFDEERIFEIETMHLILECEWTGNEKEINYDFFKLIQGRANHRVMIFETNNVDEMFDKMENIIIQSKIAQSGDRFLLAGWTDTEEAFEHRLVIKARF